MLYAISDTGEVGKLTRKKGGMAYLLLESGKTVKQPLSNLTPVAKRRKRDANGHSVEDPAPMAPMVPGEIPMQLRRAPSEHGNTDQIQIRAEGVFRGALWTTLERQFPLVSGAKLYLDAFSFTTIEGKSAVTTSGASIWSNYDLKAIMAGKQPKGPLPNILHHYKPAQRALTMPKPKDTDGATPRISRGSKSGPTVSLKEVLARMTPPMEGRDARIKLRKGGPGLPPASDTRWEWAPGDVDAVIAFLTTPEGASTHAKGPAEGASKPEKAKPVAKPAGKSPAPAKRAKPVSEAVARKHARPVVAKKKGGRK